MPKTPLSSDATLADVVKMHLLAKPEEYVRRALSNLHSFAKEKGNAQLRIGVTGTGHSPHYRIDAPEEVAFGDPDDEPLRFDSIHKIYNGSNHEELTAVTAEQLRGLHWSTRAMSVEELKQLLGELRGHKRK